MPASVSLDGATVHASVELPGVSRREALAAWTRPSILKEWWGGELETDLRPGGRYVVRFAGLEQTMRGEVLEYEPESGLVLTWTWEHEAETPPRQLTIRVLEIRDGSRVEIEHGPYGDSEHERADAEGSKEGWQHFLPRLASRLMDAS